jgi:hypothetical protein
MEGGLLVAVLPLVALLALTALLGYILASWVYYRRPVAVMVHVPGYNSGQPVVARLRRDPRSLRTFRGQGTVVSVWLSED